MILYKKLFFYPSCPKTIFSNKRVFNFEFYLTLSESKIKIQNYNKNGEKSRGRYAESDFKCNESKRY